MESNEIYTSMIQPKGRGYRSDQIESYSHYNTPIDHSAGRAAGNSRIWGDASAETQSKAIDALIASSERAGLKPREIAYVLATARVESGFNPDAAAGTTSAYGLGQFVNKTAASYGMHASNHNDLRIQTDALVAHYQDNAALARSRGQGEAHIYKYHHDGPSKDYGGLDIAKKEVMPNLDRYEKFVLEHQKKYGIEPPGPSAARHHGDQTHGHHGGERPAAHHPAMPAGTQTHSALNEGSHGPAVMKLQVELKALGYTGARNEPLHIDGDFGPNTKRALETFQRDHGLKANGMADPVTLGKLREVFTHDAVAKAHAPEHHAQHTPAAPEPKESLLKHNMLITNPAHPGHAMFDQARAGVEDINAKRGGVLSSQQINSMAAALAASARQEGLTRIDHVALSTDPQHMNVFAIQDSFPLKQYSQLRTSEALSMPVAQSTRTWEQADTQAMAQAQQAQAQHRQHHHDGPSMSH